MSRQWRGRGTKMSDQLARHIAGEIIDGQLEPGHQLPSEHEMIATYGVARNTLREALRRLETNGLVTMKMGPGGGPVVARPGGDDLADHLALVLYSEGATFAGVIDARAVIEPAVAASAANLINDDEIEILESTVSEILASGCDETVARQANWVFHSTISRASRNPALIAFLDSLKTLSDGFAVGVRYDAGDVRQGCRAHERIVAALRAKDPELARAEMARHLAELTRYVKAEHPAALTASIRWTDDLFGG